MLTWLGPWRANQPGDLAIPRGASAIQKRGSFVSWAQLKALLLKISPEENFPRACLAQLTLEIMYWAQQHRYACMRNRNQVYWRCSRTQTQRHGPVEWDHSAGWRLSDVQFTTPPQPKANWTFLFVLYTICSYSCFWPRLKSNRFCNAFSSSWLLVCTPLGI